MELRRPPLSFWGQLPTLAFLAVPYLLGFASAVAARRSLVPAGVVLVGCALNALIVYAAWRHHLRWSLIELTLVLLERWVYQFLVCSLVVAGGIEGVKQARRRRAEPTMPPSAGTM